MESPNGAIRWEQPLANDSGDLAEARLMPRFTTKAISRSRSQRIGPLADSMSGQNSVSPRIRLLSHARLLLVKELNGVCPGAH